jgi:tRNA-dihydrouridine synthase C
MLIRKGTPSIVLAPMEGITDAPMREFLARVGGFDHMVTEFIRVSQEVVSPKVFRRHVPELATGSRTSMGIPVQVQLLGGDPERMARSAERAIEMGACGVDINFGCPAPTVNRNDGGATLLKYPERIEKIVRAMRAAVPSAFPVSVKMRLGWDDPSVVVENAKRAEQGGASWITIHGRTKVQGYTPPAYWAPMREVSRSVSIPVIANGEIWTRDDFLKCREESGCEHFMLGRGPLADPALAFEIRRELGITALAGSEAQRTPKDASAAAWAPLLLEFIRVSEEFADGPSFVLARVKQWLRIAGKRGKFVEWDRYKICSDLGEMIALLESAAVPSVPKA